MSSHGYFTGKVTTEWIVDDNENDRNMKLLEDFRFTDPDGRIWNAPKGREINGASIPQFLWSSVGSPYVDDYRRASVVHDIACRDPEVSRKEADVMFRHACIAGGCSKSQANTLYVGVRVGAWWSSLRSLKPMSQDEEQRLRNTYQKAAEEVEMLPDDAPIETLDGIIDRHFPN